MAIGTSPSSIGKVNPVASLYHICDVMRPAFPDLCKRYGMATAQVHVEASRDLISLVLIDFKGRAYMHPAFITRQEVENGDWIGLIEERFESTVNGCPTSKTYHVMHKPSFSLTEIEQAQDFVDSLK